MSHRTDTRTTKQKALEILEGGQVKSIMNGLWEIKSLTKDSTYEIELVPPSQSVSGYTCGCKAWKFTDDRICYKGSSDQHTFVSHTPFTYIR
jgi:hypothetical protein